MKYHILKFKATISYVVLIVVINSLFPYMPLINLQGQSFSSADVLVGIVYLARDFSQREIKSYVLFAMLIGGLLSYIFADKTIALASICAFFVGEFIDWILFTCTHKPLSQRLLFSSMCSCPIDSIVFLFLISRLNWLDFSIMTLFKILGVISVWFYWRIGFQEEKVIG